ncbi:MAG: MBL fold metallo-hydrolase [Anaeromicrobium sp.]|jgi:glyoxylase-like metal-dependent hydrolase (beta-lactamase superfamily II)|uniref:MBL fold metallo-hydrolase n=1 Tax=Anaeromicrobium sp. TaxID=1929132 RepID=UPI0025E13BE6|nr:MBL fold metallo-hydrolase [Anaeromicrobium sp.]MCT4595022.1 MBL fold metallo-hydrolase [Anaeromicrobium sp.]
MIIERIPAGIYATNCYILACEETYECVIIDPAGSEENILNYIEENDFTPKYIILTHGHGDHIGAVEGLREKFNLKVLIHKDDEYMLKNANHNLSALMSGPSIEFNSDEAFEDGQVIKVGNLELLLIHSPGHTRGSSCILVENVLFTGDTLFANSIGRTDLEGGSFEDIIKSIKEKLIILDENVKVLPGHGPASTIGIEKATNPYVR